MTLVDHDPFQLMRAFLCIDKIGETLTNGGLGDHEHDFGIVRRRTTFALHGTLDACLYTSLLHVGLQCDLGYYDDGHA